MIPFLKFTYADQERNEKSKNIFYSEVIQRGIFLHPNHCWFLSLAHSDKDINDTLNAAEIGFSKLRKLL